MIEISHLSKHFGSLKAVDDISLSVATGEVLGFLGPNGAGKSTTMKMICGFLDPDAGQVQVAGDDVRDNPIAVKSRIGYLPEGAPLYGDMTTRAFLKFIAQIRGYRGDEINERIQRVVDKTSLHSVLDKTIETLSKGFKRRVGLAQAILHDPQVLILDEPTDGLDPNQKHEVRNLIRSMAQDKIIILSTHILEEVDAVCTRAVIISAGKLVFDGTPDDLTQQSAIHNSLSVALDAEDSGEVCSQVMALEGVARVDLLEQTDQRVKLQVFPKKGVLLAASFSELCRQQGWALQELTVERGRLDEVFRDITGDHHNTAASAQVM